MADAAFCCAFVLLLGAGATHVMDRHYDRLHAQAMAQLGTRLPLSQFPERIGAYTRLASHDLSEGEFRMLDPTDSMIGIYRSPEGRYLELSILYWEPPSGRPSRRPDLVKRPHSPDWCFPAAGWKRIRLFDTEADTAILPGEICSVRLFERDRSQRVVLFWTGITSARTDALDQIVRRLFDMVRSWRTPPLASLHTVTIAVDSGADPESAKAAAFAFAEAFAPVLADYGIGFRPDAAPN